MSECFAPTPLGESKFFIEWTASEFEVEVAAELVELQVQLARWQYRLSDIWNDAELRQIVAKKARFWSDKVLDLSGLLPITKG